ncbi:hypothetical protein [Ectobacillus ponti]|uniref:Uncharacterized protein n=1 Tax=Ectobacillus ponti TaxID=2961894 RepID=A0AA41X623_9BACI|nr:hypothetical protein [Ectobacillus ponti]MCP8969452.1 hypothetical protein [Ectobacillus ponti]
MNTEKYKQMSEEERPLAEPKALENVKMIMNVGILCLVLLLGYLAAIGLQKGYERWNGPQMHQGQNITEWYSKKDGFSR